MPNRAYEAGNRFERRVADQLRADGYWVMQTRGSKSAADLVAIKIGEVLLVQVKSGVTTLSHEEWNGLYRLAIRYGAQPLVADRAGRLIRYRIITGVHQSNTRDWPCLSWSTDYVKGSTT